MEAPSPPTNTIFCLYCRATIYFPGLPANRYLNHLFAEHNIMYEVQSVINRTLALQLPKEYPELADGSISLPDSSNRLTSPAPSSDDGPSPAPGRSSPGCYGYMNSLDCGTQTEPINSSSISCQVDFSRTEQDQDNKVSIKVKEETDGNLSESSERHKRGCPKGGWPSRKKKRNGKSTHEFTQTKIREILERSIHNKKSKFECELCLLTFKKIFKLKMHLMKVHASDISAKVKIKSETKYLENEENGKEQTFATEKPERKSTRIVQKDKEEKTEEPLMRRFIPQNLKTETSSPPAHLQKSEAESWTEGCEYFCMLCSKSFTTFGIYKHHIGDAHGLLIEDYHAKFGRVGEVINKYTCKICHQEVVHKFTNLKVHMKSCHNMTIEEYNEKHNHVKKSDKKEQDAKSPDPLCEEMESMPATPVFDKASEVQDMQIDEASDNVSEPGSENEVGKKRWYEGCSYTCLACNKPYDIYFSYHGHIKKIHKLSMEQYHSQYGVIGEINRYYSCKICNTNVVWRLFNVRKHMESQHELSLDQYGSMYESENFEKDVKMVTKESRRDSQIRENKAMTENVECKKPKVWYEGCLYSCQVEGCMKMYNLQDAYTTHINTTHNISLEQYHMKYGSKGDVLQQYQCLICNAKIAHKYNNISSHLSLIHDLTIYEYETEFLDKTKTQDTKVLVKGNKDSKEKKVDPGYTEAMTPIVQMNQIRLPEQFFNPEGEEANESEEHYEFTEADIILEDPIEDDEDEESIDDAEEVNINGDLIINEDVVGSESEHAWYHGSNLTCQICRKIFANDQWYFHHFSKIHGMTKEQYNAKYGKDGEIWNQYQCLICNSEIRWKYSSIRQHLKQVHGTTIQDYEARYMDAEPEDIMIEPLAALREKAMNPCHEVSPPKINIPVIPHIMKNASILPPPPPLKASPAALAARKNLEMRASTPTNTVFTPPPTPSHMALKGSITFDNRPSSQWYHGSDLTCEICQKSFVDFTYYCTHIRTTHQISKEQYNEKYGTAAEAFRLYRCLVCGISIKWTYQSICGHLKSHEMTIKEYELKYNVLENQSTESGKIPDLTMNANANVVNSDESPAPKRPKLTDSIPPLVPIQQTEPPLEQRVVPQRKNERISADVHSPTGKWYNQCKFTCKACPEEKYFTVPQALRMHLNGIHSLSRKEYEGRYGGAETITKYWTCLICNKELKCQKGIIIQHLLNVHSMELVDYERQYMDAGDQVVARESRKPRKIRVMSEAPIPKNDSNDAYPDPSDLTRFLVQRMDEGMDNVSLDGPAITEELPIDPPMDENITSISTLEVEGMDHVPWHFGCRYSCQICNKVWHYPQAARYHLDSVHKLTRAAYELQYGTCEIETRIFHCSICQRTMKCERDIIKYHLEAKHAMSLENYIDQIPNPIVTIGESRRSNAATHARAVTPSSLPMLQMFATPESSPIKLEMSPDTGGKAPWYRGSKFTCIPCNRHFTAQVSYISHINTKHGMNLREYREQFGSVEEIKQYMCKIPGCTRFVSWTYSGINDHLKSHNLTMAQYEQQYLGIGVSTPLVLNTMSVSEQPNLEPEDFSTVVENWANGYLRECKICKRQVVGSTQSFTNHLLEKHQITLTEYTVQHGNADNKTEHHTCHLCNNIIEHQFDNLKNHIETHSITIEHYYHKFIGSTNRDATNAEIIVAKPTIEPSKPEPKPQIQITSISALNNSTPIKVRKNHWANGCSYQCILCKGQKYPEEFMFKKHIMTAHNMAPEEYQNNFGDPALVKQLHICKVCNKDVKHEYTAILNHLRVKHNLTLTQYTQTYIKLVTTGPPPGSETDDTSPRANLVSPTSSTNNESGQEDQFYFVYSEQEPVPK